jgi:hypothetical protein
MAIVLQAPGPNINFGTAPSGSTYISDPNGLVVITNGSMSDESYLLGAGCIGLVPGGFGGNANQTGTSYTVQASDLAQEIICTNAGAFTLNLPATFPVGFYVNATQGGAGTVTANALGSGTLVGAHSSTSGQYLQIKCVVIANNAGLTAATWDVMRVGG